LGAWQIAVGVSPRQPPDRRRTQAIQRLGSDWTEHDPVAEAGTLRCDRQRELLGSYN
jgi:hypothetical protein